MRELCEEGSSMESIEVKRNEFASELCEMRAVFKVCHVIWLQRYLVGSAHFRGRCLGVQVGIE